MPHVHLVFVMTGMFTRSMVTIAIKYYLVTLCFCCHEGNPGTLGTGGDTVLYSVRQGCVCVPNRQQFRETSPARPQPIPRPSIAQ